VPHLRTSSTVAVLSAVTLATSLGATVAIAATAMPSGRHFTGDKAVGALFYGPQPTGKHFCTASVVHSPGGDLVLTAAHCVHGTGSNLIFVPKYHAGAAPYGSWQVRAIYIQKGWLDGQNPQDDYAFLAIRPRTQNGEPVSLQSVVGANYLSVDRRYGLTTQVIGYPDASNDPITCTNHTYDHDGYPGFACRGYTDGTSGGPFLVAVSRRTGEGEVDGVIGGLHQGGCDPQFSYSAYFTSAVTSLYRRAVAGGPGDDVPAAGGNGC
jgi:V8-like Glu-specific endopeptidase